MKRSITLLFALLLALSVNLSSAWAAPSEGYTFSVTSSDKQAVTVPVGAVFPVELTLRPDAGASFPLYAMQDYICFDPARFSLVDGSITVYTRDGRALTEASLTQTRDAVFVNCYGLNGLDTPSGTVIVRFQLKALQAGTATISSRRAEMIGSDLRLFPISFSDLTVTAEAAPPAGGGGGGAGGGGGGAALPESNTETVLQPDGTRVETAAAPDGSTSITATRPDGSTATAVTADGRGTTVTADFPRSVSQSAAEADTPLTVPIPPLSVADDQTAAVEIRTHIEAPVSVVLPIEGAPTGAVVYFVNPDGSRSLCRKTAAGPTGLTVVLTGDVSLEIADNASDFRDTSSHWASSAIDFVSARALFQGTSPDRFSPRGTMTRSMLATVLWRLENEAFVQGDTVFSDVPSGTWYTDAVRWAAAQKIVEGSGDRFAPTRPVTREQLAAMLYRYAASAGFDVSARDPLSAFSDADQLSPWAKDAMEWAVAQGLITGKSGALLDASGLATRAEVAVLFQRMVSLLV